ncbi:MAG: hypothetical protein NC918_06065 [Candidatus Omnitrophica bacterium]|nr:hypothetical protein [Candidatus Omnitrophota bacterium]
MLVRIKKAQSTLEYALLIGVVVGALLTMQNYLKRSFQGKLQAVADQVADPYSPGLTKRVEIMQSSIEKAEEITTKGVDGTTTTTIAGATQSATSTRELKKLDMEKWH